MVVFGALIAAGLPLLLGIATIVVATGKIITGAALNMVAVFGAFAFGRLVEIQQMGFDLAVAVFLEATVVRSVLVPAAMRLLGDRNWYLPCWPGWLPDLRIDGAAQPETTAGLAAVGHQPRSIELSPFKSRRQGIQPSRSDAGDRSTADPLLDSGAGPRGTFVPSINGESGRVGARHEHPPDKATRTCMIVDNIWYVGLIIHRGVGVGNRRDARPPPSVRGRLPRSSRTRTECECSTWPTRQRSTGRAMR